MNTNEHIVELLSCRICFEQYDTIYRLPSILLTCGHTFCQCCIHQIMSTKTEQSLATCPTCRTTIDDHRGTFQINYAIIGMFNMFSSLL